MISSASFIVCGLLILAGCGGSQGGTEPRSLSGSVIFSYSGPLPGNRAFGASGAMTSASVLPPDTNGAGGVGDGGETSIMVTAVEPLADSSSYNEAVIRIPRTTPGAVAVDGVSAGVVVQFGDNAYDDSGRSWCHLVSGSLVVTSISSTRARGSFSGSGVCFTDSLGDRAFDISNGSFDVAIASRIAQ